MKNCKFEIGDIVRITKSGNIYNTYRDKFIELGFKNKEVNNEFDSGVGEIFAITTHNDLSNDILLAIRNIDGDETLIHQDGVEHEDRQVWNKWRLAYARKHYPIGTVIKSMSTGNELTLTGEPVIFSTLNGSLICTASKDLSPFIYSDGEWAEIISKSNRIETSMEAQKLSREGLKEIHSVACPAWKEVLEHYGSRNPLENYIELTQNEVNKMFKACTQEQLPIVSKYLKQDDGSVDVTKCVVKNKGILTEDELFYMIRDREFGEYKNKSFLLSPQHDWEIKEDKLGYLCLIPTKKK